METKGKWIGMGVAAGITALLGVSFMSTTVQATPPQGVSSTTILKGEFQPVDAKVKTGDWKFDLSIKGESDLYLIENRVAPGGSFGWHSHPGPSFVIVKAGELSFYRGDDKTCTPSRYGVGMGFVDPGGVVHLARNEGATEVVVLVTSFVPSGATRRIDQPAPGNCTF